MALTAVERARRYKAKAKARRRLDYPDTVIGYWKEAMRQRIDQTRIARAVQGTPRRLS